ncbi:hypothetical protein [Vibrio sp. D431a]|uniref:hypothetical protein n=1 Tax=Vibrio sp. D431a TaxID=2837388 RepID=UPI002552FF4E|nr:hypothetical protein [Vibrio sp. D431a]MDK9790049.1 hypothetical protein [Vibrio sp. D431a]
MSSGRGIIIFDFDDTWSLDRRTFVSVRNTFTKAGFSCVLCTSRSESDPTNVQIYQDWAKEDVVFTEGEQKLPYLERVGFPVDEIAFFIDDTPNSIPEISSIGKVFVD